MAWTIQMAAQGNAYQAYTSVVDLEFADPLYDFGAATFVLASLDGNATPDKNWACRIVWDLGLSTEQVHWTGYLTQVQRKQQGNVYAIRAFTVDGLLHIAQTGTHRNYLSKSPHTIIQAAGSPNPLLVDSAGNTRITYGSAGGVPNKVDGGTPGTVLDQFVADSATLFNNVRRLCLQARYGDGSYGLEWVGTLEGANLSSPRFYLVKRRERSGGYTPEVFTVPDDFTDLRRGSDQAPSLDRVKVIGAGDGTSRIESATVSIGTQRDFVAKDKAIFNATNALNMANRLLDLYGSNIEAVIGNHYRYTSPSRAGDTVRLVQSGFADSLTRIMFRHYSLSTKAWTIVLGRPTAIGRDSMNALIGLNNQDQTTPQYTDDQAVVGDEPEAITPTGANAVTAGAGVFGAWVSLALFTPSVDFLADYVLATISSYNDSANNHDYDFEARIIENAVPVTLGTIGTGVAIAATPQTADDTITYYTPVVIPLNLQLLSSKSYVLRVRARSRSGVAFTDDFVGQGVVFKQHSHNEL